MQSPIGKLEKYGAQSIAVIATAMAGLGMAFGGAGLAAASLMSFLWLAWRFDNDSGTFLVLAVLFLIVLSVLALLLGLMALAH